MYMETDDEDWHVDCVNPHMAETGRLLPATNLRTNGEQKKMTKEISQDANDFDRVELSFDGKADQEDEDEEERRSRPTRPTQTSTFSRNHCCCQPKLYVFLASAVAALGGILFGYDTGVISGAVVQLNEDFTLSCRQTEIVVSALMAGALIASTCGGFLVDWFGRRKTIIANDILFIVGTVVLSSARSFVALLVGRLIIGFAVSLSATAECVYITEISPASRRGFLVSLNELGITVGFLTAYLVNFIFIDIQGGWRYMFGFAAILAIVQGFGMLFLPESPRYLIIKGFDQQAKRVLSRLFEKDEAEEEFERIRTNLADSKGLKMANIFRGPSNSIWTPLLISITLVSLQQMSGQPSVLLYAPIVFREVGLDSKSASVLATVGLGIVKVVVTLLYLFVVDKNGSRRLLMTGAGIMAISLLGLGILTGTVDPKGYVAASCGRIEPQANKEWRPEPALCLSPPHVHPSVTTILETTTAEFNAFDRHDASSVTWMAMLAVFGYVAGYSIGFGPGTWLILSEIFPSPVKGRAVSFAMTVNWTMHMITSVAFLDAIVFLGSSWLFICFAVVSSIAIVFVYFFVPETKGKSLEMISSEVKSELFRRTKATPLHR